jgi:hypothetical protein
MRLRRLPVLQAEARPAFYSSSFLLYIKIVSPITDAIFVDGAAKLKPGLALLFRILIEDGLKHFVDG